jgi:hypothetical protein
MEDGQGREDGARTAAWPACLRRADPRRPLGMVIAGVWARTSAASGREDRRLWACASASDGRRRALRRGTVCAWAADGSADDAAADGHADDAEADGRRGVRLLGTMSVRSGSSSSQSRNDD